MPTFKMHGEKRSYERQQKAQGLKENTDKRPWTTSPNTTRVRISLLQDAKAAADTEWDKLKHLLACHFKNVKPKSEVTQQAKKYGISVHFTSLMDLCHLKDSELEKHLNTYKGRVVLRRDNVKDDRGCKAVFTEQGASASQVAATNLGDELPGLRKPPMQCQPTHRRICQKPPQILAIARERMPTRVDTTIAQSKTETLGSDS